jgi:hypothetical protein
LSHHGQMSKTLSRLPALDLLVKQPGCAGRPNAWRSRPTASNLPVRSSTDSERNVRVLLVQPASKSTIAGAGSGCAGWLPPARKWFGARRGTTSGSGITASTSARTKNALLPVSSVCTRR